MSSNPAQYIVNQALDALVPLVLIGLASLYSYLEGRIHGENPSKEGDPQP